MNDKAKFKLNDLDDTIIQRAKEIKQHALDIQKELDDVIRFADSVVEHGEDAIHFQLTPHDNTSWRKLPAAIVELDTKIKARQDMKWILRDLGITR